MAKVVLYGTDLSPPVRACLLTLNALELPFEYKIVNLQNGENMNEEFIKHNPQHTVPLLDDDGTWIWDSHAICTYLVDKYGKDDTLYPKDLAKRAVVDQRLFFDASILFMAVRNIVKPLLRKNITVVMKEKTENILEGYGLIETFLGENPYLTGDTLTIADFSCVSTVSSARCMVDIQLAKFPKTFAWLERMSQLPYYEKANGKGAAEFAGIIKSKLTTIIL